MKEFIAQSGNASAVFTKDGLKPMTEVIIVTSEPQYAVDSSGELVRSRTTESFRFITPPEGLRQLSKFLLALADDADAKIAAAMAERNQAEQKA